MHKSSLTCLERLKVLVKVEKQMKKLTKMKESLINGGTSKLATGKSLFIASILANLTGVELSFLETYDGITSSSITM